MSIFQMTGFDHNVYAHRYGIAGSIASPGRFGRGRYARFSNGNHYCNLNLQPGEEYNSWVIGFACRETTSPYTNLAYSSAFIRLFGDTGASNVDIYWTSGSGNYYVRARNGDGTVLQDSAPIALVQGVWRYYEFKVTIDDTLGAIEVRRDGVTIINVSGVDTRNNSNATNDVHTIRFGQNANNSYGSLDDVYVLKQDGVGEVDFLGEVEVEHLRPSGNGTYSQLVGSDADSVDNYLLVDDGTGVNDGDYVGSSVDGEKDTYVFDDLLRTNPIVIGMQYSYRVQKDDTDPKSIRSVIRTGGTDYTGADFALPSSYIWNQEMYENNPNTGVPWTGSELNGAEAGTEVRP